MTKTNSKKALLSSAFALVVSIAMLIGTTFAWFTDTASTGVNKIQSGNLSVKLEYKNSKQTAFTEATDKTKVFDENALWEPGHTEYVVLKVSNQGNLALKYKLGVNIVSENGGINVDDEEFKLSDYIKFGVVGGDMSALNRADLIAAAADGKKIKEGYTSDDTPLLPKGEDGDEKVVTLVVWMPETVGNEANYKTGTSAPSIDLGINVVATQYTYEKDSFGNQYDADAAYPVFDVYSFKKALDDVNNSDTVNKAIISVTKDISYDDVPLSVAADKDIRIDLGGNNLTLKNTSGDGFTLNSGSVLTLSDSTDKGQYVFDNAASNSDGIFVSNDDENKTTVLNIEGNVQINVDSKANSAIHAYAKKGSAEVNINGAKVTISGTEQTSAIIIDQNATLNMNDGELDIAADFDSYSDNNDVVGILLWGQNGKQENCTVNMNGGKIRVGGRNAFAQGIQIGMKNGYSNNLNVNITGGKIELAATENGKGYAFTTYKDVYGKFTMSGGEVAGNITAIGLAYIGNVDLTITGGTFGIDPTEYLGDGHTVSESNGLWIVQ